MYTLVLLLSGVRGFAPYSCSLYVMARIRESVLAPEIEFAFLFSFSIQF